MPKKTKYTAFIYIHGIGQRRRHDDIGQILQNVNEDLRGYDAKEVGRFFSFKAQLEPNRIDPNKDDIPYVAFERLSFWRSFRKFRGNYRAYQVYWSPVTSAGLSALAMMFWLFRHIPQLILLIFAGWRHHQDLRRGELSRLLQREPNSQKNDFVALSAHFDDFQRIRERGEYPDESFSSFASFVATKHKDVATKDRLFLLLKRWDTLCIRRKITLAGLLSVPLFVICISVALSFLAIWSIALKPGENSWLDQLTAHWGVVILAFISLTLQIALIYFLATTVSDVRFWVGYLENDRLYNMRRRILAEATQLIEHVVEDPNCMRVIIIGHSLGSAIAQDSLKWLASKAVARQPAKTSLSKISHLITLGSPIDKLRTIYEAVSTKFHRTNRIREDLDPSLFQWPLAIKWINFWNRNDLISDFLRTPKLPPADDIRRVEARIENIEIKKWRMRPIRAHIDYTSDSNVIGSISDVLIFQEN